MSPDAPPSSPEKPGPSARDMREARRKEALKANMGRRKAQAQARSKQDEAEGTDTASGPEGE